MTEDPFITIKIRKSTRNEAQDDPRTYTEIMDDGLDAEGVEPTRDELRESLERLEDIAELLPERVADEVEARQR